MSSRNNNVNEHKPFAFDLNVEPLDDGNSDFPENSDLCTICIEPLVGTNNDHPTLVTLKCDHKFHLDCIGSAFNAKGLMQCPNCKQIEPGQWRYGPNHPIQDVSDDDRIVEDEEITYNAMAMGLEWCPFGLGQCYYFEAPQCPYIEYTFTIPESTSVAAAAGAAPNFNTSEWIATRRLVHNFVPLNRRIFWSLSEPRVMRGRHYLAHPSCDHSDPSYGSDSSMGTAPVCPFCPGSSSGTNAPVPPPYPYSSTVQPNQVPSLLGDSSASVSCGYIFSSGPGQVASGMYDAWSRSANSNQVNNNGFDRFNALEGQPFSELVAQFEIERQTYFILYNGSGGESGNGGGGGSGSGGGGSDSGGGESDSGGGGSDSGGSGSGNGGGGSGNGGGESDSGGGGSDSGGGGSGNGGGGGSDGNGGGDGGSSSDGGDSDGSAMW